MAQNFSVLIFGPFSSGKTQFVHTLNKNDVKEKQICDISTYVTSPVVFDWGQIFLDDLLILNLFAPPGMMALVYNHNFDHPYMNFIGGIFLVDSTRPEVLRECRARLEVLRNEFPGKYIIAASKQDLEKAISLKELSMKLELRSDEIIVPLVSYDYQSAAETLVTLLERVETVISPVIMVNLIKHIRGL